jgi:uncharacterized protein YcaQ
MPMKTLSLDAVRGLMIAAQGLHDHPQPPATKKAVRSIIRQMHILQIDTINVIARSPYLVLWSRLRLQSAGWRSCWQNALFEYWSHAACFLPIEEYPCIVTCTGWEDAPQMAGRTFQRRRDRAGSHPHERGNALVRF